MLPIIAAPVYRTWRRTSVPYFVFVQLTFSVMARAEQAFHLGLSRGYQFEDITKWLEVRCDSGGEYFLGRIPRPNWIWR
ncbi:hypothetical protein F5Y17DRAFT_443439 [Xylariaceae sp. FL0594]|nr:hypothetical protein F5Y17DRAFT_443439 [Xylariaceae sp. FL0594]